MSIYGMDPGDLREEVVLQVELEEEDGQGGVESSWNDSTAAGATIWAKVQPSTSQERQVAFRVDGPISHLVTVRSGSGVTREHRLRWGTRFLKVVGPPVNLDRRGQFDTFPCLEGGHG